MKPFHAFDGASSLRDLGLLLVGGWLWGGVGCALPGRDSAPPYSFSTDRFEVHSWSEQEESQAVAGWAEELLPRVESILGKLSRSVRPRLKLFASRGEFLEHVGLDEPGLHGLFVCGAEGPEILFPVEDCDVLTRETLVHELAHLCLAHRYPSDVPWLVEVVCEYVEAALTAEAGEVGDEHVESRLDDLHRIRSSSSRFPFREDPAAAAWLVAYVLEETDAAGASAGQRIMNLLASKEEDIEDLTKTFQSALARGLWKERKQGMSPKW